MVFRDNGYGTPVLIGREEQVRETMKTSLGITDSSGMEIHNARLSTRNAPYTDLVYNRLQRDGFLRRDVQRMVNQAATCRRPHGGDGRCRRHGNRHHPPLPECYADVERVIDAEPNRVPMGYSIVVARHGTVFLGDTSINETPTPSSSPPSPSRWSPTPAPWDTSRALPSSPSPTSAAARSIASSASARRSACSTPRRSISEYDGEMQADMALDYELLRETYPFCRLTGPANVLVMPACIPPTSPRACCSGWAA